MTRELEPLPDDVRAVLHAGAFGPALGEEARARLLSRIAASAAISPSIASSASGIAGKVAGRPMVAVALAFAGGVAAGIAGHVAWQAHAAAPTVGTPPPVIAMEPHPVEVVPPPSPSRSPSPVITPVIEPQKPARSPAPARASTPRPPLRQPPRASESDLAAENALITRARAALVRGDAQGALAAVAEHETRFADGALSEEREVVRVQALVASDQRGEADARARRFHEQFPNSMFGPAVDGALIR
jgi:hypothetical protein